MSISRFTQIIARWLPQAGAVLLFTLVTSCSDDELSSPSEGRYIRFAVPEAGAWSRSGGETGASEAGGLATVSLDGGGKRLYLIPEVTAGITGGTARASRGSEVTTATIADFGVYASTGSDAAAYYMDNVEVTKENSWAPSREYLWPGSGSLHINAYSPYCSTPATDGITALPTADVSASPALEYTVPADVTAQSDLMWATPRDASASPCPMEFNHALAAVKFVTGEGMTPCTVKSITISGVPGSGTLDLETGLWSDTAGSQSYTASVDVALTAADVSEDAAEGIALTDDAHTFMLLPQTLGEDASVILTIEYGGAETEFTASLTGQTWNAGNTYTYHLSANPTLDRFVITVASPLSFNYTGGTGSYEVKSIHETMHNGVLTTSEVPWIAEFVDDDGNVIDTPKWITSMSMSGPGSGEYEAATQMVEPTFVQMSQPTRILRGQAEVGSAQAPYNLANATGAPTVENTANSYIINAPGTYSIPLVYGNAIKNGADNTAAYAPTRSAAPFVNHLGNRIKHPYISDNEGCGDPAEAVLVWEGRLNMIHNLRLSADLKSLVFEIPQAYIRQGNAVVAVADASGRIMWSWQLWVTDYVAGTELTTLTYNGKEFSMMPYNMGYVVGGDETDFASSYAKVRFTQKPADGSQGSTATVVVQQTGKHLITPDCYSFYQWGRKDPMISSIKEWYYADHTEITAIDTRDVPISGTRVEDDFDALCVKNPQVFWISPSGEPTFRYTNNWNLGSATAPVKTVYDPCPPGYMVPGNELMLFRDMDTYTFTPTGGTADPAGFHAPGTSGPELFFPALGYRSGNSGNETVTDATGGNLATLWTSHGTTREAGALILSYDNEKIIHRLPSDPRLEAFAVRPISE